MLRRFVLASALALGFTVVAGAQVLIDRRFNVHSVPDVFFADAPVKPSGKTKPLYVDLYLPEGDGAPDPSPTVILVHGGGFRRGDRKSGNIVALCNDLATRGYACVSIDYRVEGDNPATGGPSPRHQAIYASMEDTSASMEWVTQNARRYKMDAARMAVGGMSAGSTAALLAAYANPAELPPVRTAIAMWGGIAGPLSLIHKGQPPMLIIHGTADQSVPFFVATDMEKQAKKEGVPVRLIAVPGAGHGIDLSLEFEGKSFYDHIAEFLYPYMK